MNAQHTMGRIMAGIERQIAHFRADPLEADATPADVISVADYAAKIDAQRAALLKALEQLIADDDIYRQTGRIVPRDASYWAEARAAIAIARGDA